MKKILITLLSITLTSSAFTQASKWSVSLNPGPGIGGPNGSLANKMRQQNFDQKENITFLFFSADFDYPIKRNDGSFLIKVTKKQKEYRSLYFVAGLSGAGHVEGFRNEGDFMIFPFIGGSSGAHVNIDHKTWQISAGYQYSFPKTRATLALAPSVFLFHYKLESEFNPIKETKFIPGVSLNARLPLGKEKRLIGVEVFTDLNLAPPAKMKDMNVKGDQNYATFKPGSVNMVHGSLGLALSVRRR